MTPRGRGAIATIRVEGCRRELGTFARLFRASNGKALEQQPTSRIVFGRWGTGPSEEVVVRRISEHTVEVHCHGGEAAARRILEDLRNRGVTITGWRDLLALTEGILQAECTEALARATTFRTASILLEQQSGLLHETIAGLVESVVPASPDVMDDPAFHFIDRERSLAVINSMLEWSEFGRHLTRPWQVVLVGRPNVGKSSLINALVGYARSIVYAEPGTTRDVITAETAFGGWPVRMFDTAGFRDEGDVLESAGRDRARKALEQADCRVLLFDIGAPRHPEDDRLLAEWPDALVVAHKCDLADRWGKELPEESLRVSSLTGEGLEELSSALVVRLVPRVPPSGTPIPVTERQIALLEHARQALIRDDPARFRDSLQEILGPLLPSV